MSKHNVNTIKSNDFQPGNGFSVIYFYADWHEPCLHMSQVFEELSRTYPNITFFKADAEQVEEFVEKYNVEEVPTFVFLENGKSVKVLEGANAPELNEMIAHYSKAIPKKVIAPVSDENIDERLKNLINSQPVMVFIKGTPSVPQCGFSRELIEILGELNCSYGSFDILSDESVRQGLKKYSNWPTYPQVYIHGELIGGLDIVKELVASGEIQEMLPGEEELKKRLEKLVNKSTFMLFMKGSPDNPKCGFSRTIVGILNDHQVNFGQYIAYNLALIFLKMMKSGRASRNTVIGRFELCLT
jgi:Grx4 family monothiol glutaredoxin